MQSATNYLLVLCKHNLSTVPAWNVAVHFYIWTLLLFVGSFDYNAPEISLYGSRGKRHLAYQRREVPSIYAEIIKY